MMFAIGRYSPITKEWKIVTVEKKKPKKQTIEEKAREMGQIEMFPS